jgi:hypothetical protein
MEEFSRIDVRALLAGIQAPAIVFHSEHEALGNVLGLNRP